MLHSERAGEGLDVLQLSPRSGLRNVGHFHPGASLMKTRTFQTNMDSCGVDLSEVALCHAQYREDTQKDSIPSSDHQSNTGQINEALG